MQGRHLPRLLKTPQVYLTLSKPLHPYHMDEQLHCSLSKLHLQPQQWESKRNGVSRTQPDRALMHATGCPHSPPGSVTECLPQGPMRKQVHCNLTKDLDDTLPLPADLAHFLGDATDEHIDASCPPAPLVKSYQAMVIAHSVTPLWEDPSQRPIQLHQTCLQLPVKPGLDAEVHQTP